MVISGINAGANLGDDVWYSGTVAAAMEGRFWVAGDCDFVNGRTSATLFHGRNGGLQNS